MKYCGNCGTQINEGVEICPNCGAKNNNQGVVVTGEIVNNQSVNTNTKTGEKDNVTTAFVCSIIGCLCCTYVAIPGLILSIMALKDMKEGKISSEKKWMAITGIVLSALGLIQMVNNFVNPNPDVQRRVDEIFNKG